MSLFHFISYSLFLIGALEIILGTILLRNNRRKSSVQKAVAALSLFSAAFSLTSAFMYLRASLGLPIDLAVRINWIGWFTIPAGLQIIYYLKDERSRVGHIVGLILYPLWTVILCLCLFTDLIVQPGYSVIPFINHPGPLEYPARLFGSLLAFWLIGAMIRFKKVLKGIKRAQLNYFFHGVLIFGLGASTTAGILQLFGGFGLEPGLAAFFSLPWVLLTYIAITRHRLFDIRYILSRVLSTALVLFLFSIIQITIFKLLKPEIGESFAILLSLFFIGIVFFTTRLNSKMQHWVLRLALQNRLEYQAVLKESTKAIISILDLDELLDYVIASIQKSLGVKKAFFSFQKKGRSFTLRRRDVEHNDPASSCRLHDDVIEWLRQKGNVIVRQELEHNLSDEKSVFVQSCLEKMEAELVIPLLYKGDIKGWIILGQKGNEQPYLQSDIDLLEVLAGHAAIAIENAQLYEEARQAKEIMQESEAKFRTLAETASTAIFMHRGGNFLYVNHAAEVIGGYTVDEYLSMHFMSLVHPDYIDLVTTRARERSDGSSEIPTQHEFKIIKKNGDERWVLRSAGVTMFEGENTVMVTLIDITARKQAEEEREKLYRQLQGALLSLKESEARFRTLAETTTAGIFIHRGGRFIYANPAITKITGYKRDEFLDLDFWTIVHPEYREMLQQRGLDRVSGSQLPQEYEIKIIIKSGEERWGSLSVGMIEYEGERAVIVTFFDVTDRKRAEEETVKLYEQRIAEEKRHLMEKEKILMDLHDGIGGITTNISILSELAQKATDIDNIKQTLSTISRLSREGIAEIRNFMHSLDSQELNWRSLAAELRSQGTNMVDLHRIAFALEASVEDIQEKPGSLLWVNLFKIYKEALTNIIKHAHADSITVSLQVAKEGILLDILDNGTGWEERRGNGRGLSNMNKRAEELGGRITISSDGRGTRVTLEVPLPLKYPVSGMVL
jgi:PAS domain S-box-containing protein